MAEDPELEDLLAPESLAPVNSAHAGSNKEDLELADLLDSALEDFEKPSNKGDDVPEASTAVTSPKDGQAATGSGETSDNGFPYLNELLKGFAPPTAEEDPASGITVPPPEMNFLKNLLQEDPRMMGQFEQLAAAVCNVDETESSQKEFSESLTSTLTALTANVESLKGEMTEEEMMAALAGLHIGGGPTNEELRDDISLDGDDDDVASSIPTVGDANSSAGPSPSFLPMLGGVMRSILSKDVLYPSLLEIAGIYPSWLEENKASLSDEDFTRYERQYVIISEVVEDFEKETPSSDEEDKQRRFDRVLVHMQKMHELGQPPKELLLKLDPSMESNPGGVPMMPQPGQCGIM